MSNGGLERAIADAGGRLIRTPVGDRHVFEAMERHDAVMGGEQSGHIIFRERRHHRRRDPLGDRAHPGPARPPASRSPRSPRRVPRLPQVVLNSAVRHKDQWQIDPDFNAAVAQATERLRGTGRILVRPSGTEPKLRIMVEGDDPEEIDAIARELDELAQARLN